jgi:hypothetical protein
MDHPGQFTVTKLASELGLDRRQALNALHGLKAGLGDQLERTQSGAWSYTPRTVLTVQPDVFDESGPTTKVPLGWVGQVRVIARIGNQYLGQILDENGEPNGLHLTISPVVGGVERLDPFPT